MKGLVVDMCKVYVGLVIVFAVLMMSACGGVDTEGGGDYTTATMPTEITAPLPPTGAVTMPLTTVSPTTPAPTTLPEFNVEVPTPPLASEVFSDYGLLVARDFLAQMISLDADFLLPITYSGIHVDLGWREEGQFILGWDHDARLEIISYEVPPLYFRRHFDEWGQLLENHGFFDAHGNKLTDEIWILGDAYATHFRLWDFDGSGIPVITVYYAGNMGDVHHNSGATGRIFKYVAGIFVDFPIVRADGNQRFARHTDWSHFFRCTAGDLWRSDVGFGGAFVQWYDTVVFVDGETIFSPVARFTHGADSDWWDNYITGEMNIPFTWDPYGETTAYTPLEYHLGFHLTRIPPITPDW